MVRDVLVVDDEEDVRDFLKSLLEDHGFAVRLAEDGLQAMTLIREAKPDLRRQLRRLLADYDHDRSRLRQLLECTDSIAYALTAARRYVDSAVTSIRELPPSGARNTLISMTRLIIDRQQ